MLYLNRKINESIVINDEITITISEIQGKNVKLGIKSPKNSKIFRKELYDLITEENLSACINSHNKLRADKK